MIVVFADERGSCKVDETYCDADVEIFEMYLWLLIFLGEEK